MIIEGICFDVAPVLVYAILSLGDIAGVLGMQMVGAIVRHAALRHWARLWGWVQPSASQAFQDVALFVGVEVLSCLLVIRVFLLALTCMPFG